ncbi:uncharacterized protein LOC126598400 isoform X2 [Malus sylvestris]|uniref:uncharacterized protein LOC126598400 isoform X2 n=1 Tax=Malus sylvestris TaxID=3752 RepID=UPI0021ACB6F2|nr:uncharacterized protein LOC126598400 isoform X2 [Malus sylvestris]
MESMDHISKSRDAANIQIARAKLRTGSSKSPRNFLSVAGDENKAKSPWLWLSSTAHQLHNPPPQSQPTTLEHSRSNLSPSESTAANSSLSFPVVSELVRARQDRRRCRKLKGDLESAQEVFDEMSERTVAKFG